MNLADCLGANIRRLRSEKGWSQEQLADNCGIHRTYVSGLERGRRNPTLSILQTVADAFEVSPSTLLQCEVPDEHIFKSIRNRKNKRHPK